MKEYRGQAHVPVKTAEDLADEIANRKAHDHEDAVEIDAYFAAQGIRNFTIQEMMRAVAPKGVTRMTPAKWSEHFSRNGF